MTDADTKPKKKPRIAPVQTTRPINANDAIAFHFVEDTSKVVETTAVNSLDGYPPGMTHQIFDDEEILGYVGLKIDIVLSTDTYVPKMIHKYEKKVSPANDYVSALAKHFPQGLPASSEEAAAAAAKAHPLKEALEGCTSVFETACKGGYKVSVVRSNLASAPAALKELHNRMQPLLMFYVDAAELLEHDDPQWDIFLALKLKDDGSPACVLGFMTVYRYYAFPHHVRTRVAQILVMPPFQRQGVGRCLLQAINEVVASSDTFKDVTFEDAAEELQSLRERMDAERAVRAVPSAWAAAQDAIAAAVKAVRALQHEGGAAPADGAGDGDGVVAAMMPPRSAIAALVGTLKIVPQQAHAVWEVLLWAAGLRGRASQDDVANALQGFLVHKELTNFKPTSEDEGGQIPPNKVFVDAGKGAKENQGGEDDDEGDDDEEEGTVSNFVVYRTDLPRKRHAQRKQAAKSAAVSEDEMDSIMELVNMRVEDIERIAHGMTWPDTTD